MPCTMLGQNDYYSARVQGKNNIVESTVAVGLYHIFSHNFQQCIMWSNNITKPTEGMTS